MGIRSLAEFLLLCLVLGACADANPTVVIPETLSLTIVGDAHRTGTVGEELSEPLTVLVEKGGKSGKSGKSGKGAKPAKGVLVSFVVTEGGGTMYSGFGVTDKDGLASDYWTLGPEIGAHTVEVRAVNGDGTKNLYGTFTATAIPGPLASAEVTPEPGLRGFFALLDPVKP